MPKLHLGFNVAALGSLILVAYWLLSLNRPMTNFLGMMLFSFSLVGLVFSVLEYQLRGELY